MDGETGLLAHFSHIHFGLQHKTYHTPDRQDHKGLKVLLTISYTFYSHFK